MDEIFTIRPQPPARIWVMVCRHRRTRALILVPIISSQSSSLVSIRPPACARPELLTKISMPPNWVRAALTNRAGFSGSDTSEGTATMLPPVCYRMSLAAAFRRSFSRAVMRTRAPFSANSWAMALPTPVLPPVTIAALFSILRSTGCLRCISRLQL